MVSLRHQKSRFSAGDGLRLTAGPLKTTKISFYILENYIITAAHSRFGHFLFFNSHFFNPRTAGVPTVACLTRPGESLWRLLCGSAWVSACFIPQSKDMQVRWRTNSKLPEGIKLSLYVWLTLSQTGIRGETHGTHKPDLLVSSCVCWRHSNRHTNKPSVAHRCKAVMRNFVFFC